MSSRHDTMMSPPIEGLLDQASSKFSLVILSSKRAREINSYFNQLGEGLGAIVPPQVTSVARKPLSIAYEEIGSGKIVLSRISEEELQAESEADELGETEGERGETMPTEGLGAVVDDAGLGDADEGE